MQINKTNVFYYMVALMHFLIVLCITPPYSNSFSVEQKVIYFAVKVLSFIFLVYFYQCIPIIINAFKNKNEKVKNFVKHALFYFLLNIAVLALTYPAGSRDVDFLISYNEILNYNFYWWISYLINTDIIFAYHVIPAIWGISVFNIYLYSLIFAYIITNSGKIFEKKFVWLLYIPFCIPALLMINQNAIRLVLCSWMFLFLICFIIFNQRLKTDKYYKSILLGLLTAQLIIIRFEFFILILFIPLIIFVFKVFKPKQFIAFIVVILLVLSANPYIQNKFSSSNMYIIHNCGHILRTYLSFNINKQEIEDNKKKLQKIYPGILTNIDMDINFNSELTPAEKKILKDTMSSIFIKNYSDYVKYNWNNLTAETNENPLKDFNTNLISIDSDIGAGYHIPAEIIPKSQRQNKIVSFLTLGVVNFTPTTFSRIIYNPAYNVAILFILFLGGLIIRRYIYCYFAVLWFFILFILLLTIPFLRYLYFFPFLFCSWILFYIFIIDAMSYRKRNE